MKTPDRNFTVLLQIRLSEAEAAAVDAIAEKSRMRRATVAAMLVNEALLHRHSKENTAPQRKKSA